jgi:hypothetical protein
LQRLSNARSRMSAKDVVGGNQALYAAAVSSRRARLGYNPVTTD